MRVRPTVVVVLLPLLLTLAACDGADAPDGAGEEGLGEEAGEGPGAPADGPIPVEGDGGIGGEGGPVTTNLILPPDQVEVTATCLVTGDPPTYRLALAGGGSLEVATGDEGGRLTLDHAGRTFTSRDGAPPVVSASPGALSVQGNTVAADGAEQFVDAVIGLDDLPAC